MASDYEVALDYAAKLEAEGVAATVDPRSATPPCVLLGTTGEDPGGYCAANTDFYAALLLPGVWNADAWKLAAQLRPAIRAVIPWAHGAYVMYRLALDAPPIPCWIYTWTEGVDA